VQDWLNEHPAEPAPLTQLASLAAMSESTLTRAFRANTGLTPLQYQQKVRLEMAAGLMRDHRLTLEVVAERCGFADVRHFRRLWTNAYGQSPSHFRKEKLTANESAFAKPTARQAANGREMKGEEFNPI
jgi:transcriptional regulator GlxA family with amidase domain